MSSAPQHSRPARRHDRLPMTLPRARREEARCGEPIVMVTAYDYPSAQVAEAAGVDIVLVGDSGAMTVLGYPSTVPCRARRDAHARRGRAARPAARRSWSATCRSAPTRPPTSRRSPPRSASSRRPAATRSSSRAAAPVRRTARARSSTPASRSWATSASRRRPRRRSAATAPRAAPPQRARRRRPRRARAAGGRLLLDRLRGDPRRGGRRDHGAHGGPGHRHRRRPGDRRPGAGLPRPARHLRRPRRRASSSATPSVQDEMVAGVARLRRGRAHPALPGRRARATRSTPTELRALPRPAEPAAGHRLGPGRGDVGATRRARSRSTPASAAAAARPRVCGAGGRI